MPPHLYHFVCIFFSETSMGFGHVRTASAQPIETEMPLDTEESSIPHLDWSAIVDHEFLTHCFARNVERSILAATDLPTIKIASQWFMTSRILTHRALQAASDSTLVTQFFGLKVKSRYVNNPGISE